VVLGESAEHRVELVVRRRRVDAVEEHEIRVLGIAGLDVADVDASPAIRALVAREERLEGVALVAQQAVGQRGQPDRSGGDAEEVPELHTFCRALKDLYVVGLPSPGRTGPVAAADPVAHPSPHSSPLRPVRHPVAPFVTPSLIPLLVPAVGPPGRIRAVLSCPPRPCRVCLVFEDAVDGMVDAAPGFEFIGE